MYCELIRRLIITLKFREFSSLLYHYLQAEKSEKSKDEHLYSTIFNPTTTNAQVENTIMKIKENMESHQQIAVDHSTILPQIERKFLNSLINSMQKSGFVVLKHIELKLLTDIVKESSLYTNHVVIEWEKLNATLLSSYYDKLMLSSHLYDWDVPEYARRCLIFWRGVSMEKEVGFFHLQKLNLLLTKIFKDSGLEKFVKKFHLLREMDTKTMGESFQLRNNPRISLQMNELHLIEKQSSFVFPKVVSMKHLAVRNYSLLSLLKSFFKKEEIIEPSFDEIILVFRLDKSNKNIQNENANSIFVHRFFDVKFRDFPAIFPTKKTTRNIVDLLYFLLMAISIVSLIISISTVWAQSTYFDEALLTILFLLSPLVIRYICQLIFSFRSHRTQQKLSYNYAKHSLNCNKSVLSYIKSESIQHESVSLILIYFFLLESDGPLDIENLEGLCRQFLSENFNIPLGYKVEEGIFRLQKLGLVEIVDHKLYMAKSLEFSIKQLETLLLASARKVY